MTGPFKQDTRLGRLKTDLGKDALVLLRFGGVDAINELFEYTVDALAVNPDIDFNRLLGTHATIEIKTREGSPRFFDGIVTAATWQGVGDTGNRYALQLRPWLWIASRRRNQRPANAQERRRGVCRGVLDWWGRGGATRCSRATLGS